MLTQAEINELADITRQEKALKARKEKLVAKVKAEMTATNTDKLPCPGGTITLSKSQRASFKKNMKDPFVLLLSQKGLKSCLKVEYDVDKEILETEIAAGKIAQSEVDNYMSFSEVLTLRVNV